jgi:aryl-alcohol dehydrogenase-like predicted oxidoreductase
MAGDRYGAIEDGEAVKAIHRALDRGVNCVDTAPAYGAGHSEEVVARALEGSRKDVILVTKCGVKVPPPGQAGPLRDSSRVNILREIDASLKRLRTDWGGRAAGALAGHGHAPSRQACARSTRS